MRHPVVGQAGEAHRASMCPSNASMRPRFSVIGSLSLNQLKIQGDAYAVDEHDALIQQLLVGDLRVDELPEGLARTDELDGLGSLFGHGRELVQHGKIEQLKFHIRGNALGKV